MKFRELVKRVQVYSGFSDKESKEALEMMVESLAVHLTEGERKDFASQLPEELKDIALTVYANEDNSSKDILNQFIEVQGIDEARAKKQVFSTWRALKDAVSHGQIEHIRAQLPNKTVEFLN